MKRICLFLFCLITFSFQKQINEICYGTSNIYFQGNYCNIKSSTFRQLIEPSATKLCNNLAYLGYNGYVDKYLFITIQNQIVGYGDESNLWSNKIQNNFIDNFNFTMIQSVLLKNSIIILAIHDNDYYFITVENLSNEINITGVIHLLGPQNLVVPHLSCNAIYFFRTEDKKLFLYNFSNAVFYQRLLSTYDTKIQSIKSIRPYKVEVYTADNNIDTVTCEACRNKGEPITIIINESKKSDVSNNNIKILVFPIIVCITLLVIVLNLIGYIFYQRTYRRRAFAKPPNKYESISPLDEISHEDKSKKESYRHTNISNYEKKKPLFLSDKTGTQGE